MYSIYYYSDKLLFITAQDRFELNSKVNEVDDYIYNHLSPYVDYMQERDFGDAVHTVKELLKLRPELKKYRGVSLEEFCK